MAKVKDLKELSDNKENMTIVCKNIRGVRMKKITKFVADFLRALPGECLPMLDHTKAKNPYLSFYGSA